MEQIILNCIKKIIGEHIYKDEKEVRKALIDVLKNCEENELTMQFNRPFYSPKKPPDEAVKYCQSKNRNLTIEGKDPCEGRGEKKLDILWHFKNEHIPIELKYRIKWNSDVYGYGFLKDIHRLERLISVNGSWSLSHKRFAIFITSVSDYWSTGKTREPDSLKISDGKIVKAPYWVQYDQPSHVTKWYQYPPFFIANSYTFNWVEINNTFKCLIVNVNRTNGK